MSLHARERVCAYAGNPKATRVVPVHSVRTRVERCRPILHREYKVSTGVCSDSEW
jgi:ribosomal protein L37E